MRLCTDCIVHINYGHTLSVHVNVTDERLPKLIFIFAKLFRLQDAFSRFTLQRWELISQSGPATSDVLCSFAKSEIC